MIAAEGLLCGRLVVEIGQSRAVAFVGKLLADLGAEVWMLEPPGRGHILRRHRPLLASGTSGLFEFLARGKRSLTVDLSTEDGMELARRFSERAVGVIAERDSWDQFGDASPGRGASPGPVVVTVSPRGAPYTGVPQSEFVDFHEGGGGYMTPGRVRDPEQAYPIDMAHGGQASYLGGLSAAVALLAGIASAEAGGPVMHNDVSLQAALASMLVLNVPWYEYADVVPSRLLAAGRPTRAFGGFVRVKDGRIAITIIEEHQWDGLVRALNHPEWTTWPVFETQLDRSSNWDAMRACLEDYLQDTSAQEVMERCQAENVPVFVVRDMHDVLSSAHERARGFFAPSEPDGIALPTNPWIIDGAPIGSRGRSPTIGEHTLEALRLLGMGRTDYDVFHEVGVV